MGIEEQIDKLIDLGEDIKGRLDLLSELASDHFAGANKMVADESPKKWRILEPGEVVCSGDWVNAKSNLPHGLGWKLQTFSTGQTVSKHDECVFARPVADEPAKEPPKKWRILGVGEEVQEGDRVKAKASPPSDPPNGLGWCRADPSVGTSVFEDDPCVFARLVADEPAKEQAEEPPKKWRILEPGEVVCSGDMVNAKSNPPSDPPGGDGWVPADARLIGGEVSQSMGLYVARPVVDEPAKDPEHPAGPKPDPGEGYRILSKDPPEDLTPGDEFENGNGEWIRSSNAETTKKQGEICWYRRKIEVAKPAWEPKVGEWVRVTRPERLEMSDDTPWLAEMDRFDGKVMQVARFWEIYQSLAVILAGTNYAFKIDWLSPAEPPATEKPPEPEYREPVLPADLGKWAEFSQDGIKWTRYKLCGCYKESEAGLTIWSEKNIGFRHCRIKKDA